MKSFFIFIKVLVCVFINTNVSFGSRGLFTTTSIFFSTTRSRVVVRVTPSKYAAQASVSALSVAQPQEFNASIPTAPLRSEHAPPAPTAPPAIKTKQKVIKETLKPPPVLPDWSSLPRKTPPPIKKTTEQKLSSKTKLGDQPVALVAIPPPPLPRLPEKKTPKQVQPSLNPTSKISEAKTTIDLVAIKKTLAYSGTKHDFYKRYGEFVLIDTEATGLGNDHELTEVSAVIMKDFQPTGKKYQMYINPGREVSPSAHRLTHYTYKELKEFPKFEDIADSFLSFIGDLPLVFHNAQYDLKLLNRGLKKIIPYKLEDRHVIIDSYKFACKLFPEKRNGLTFLGELFNVRRPGNHNIHGALIDADLLCRVLRGLYRKNNSQFMLGIDWRNLPPSSITLLPSIKNSPGAAFFKALGIKSDLPDTFRYLYNCYHPRLHRNTPAVLVPFKSELDPEAGIYIRYITTDLAKHPCSIEDFDQIIRSYYGDYSSFVSVDIYGQESEQSTALIVGSITACLFLKDQLNEEPGTGKYIRSFLEPNIIVKAIPDPSFLQHIVLSEATKTLIVLSEADPIGLEIHKSSYYEIINKLCSPQFLPFSKVKGTQTTYLNWLVRYNNDDWNVIKQETLSDGKLVLHMMDIKYNKRKANVMITLEKIVINDSIVYPHSSSSFLLSPPKKNVIIIPLRCVTDLQNPIGHLIRKNPNHILERFKLRTKVYQPKDLQFYEKIMAAINTYNRALPIPANSPSDKYFKLRNLTALLPECFRYSHKSFHPGHDSDHPATVVPLTDAEGNIVAIHRLFCDENGKQLPKKDGYPSKLSLGKAAGASVELYKYTLTENEPDTLFLSEGIENALVVREVFMNTFAKNPKEFDQMLKLLGSKTGVTIHAVVGVNGLIDAPIASNIKNIVILADNDGDNKEVKSTIRKTVEHFLLTDKTVKIVLPTHPTLLKTDLNDIYILESLELREKAILDIIKAFHSISTADQLGSDDEKLESSLKRIVLSLVPEKKPEHLLESMEQISSLEQQLMELISDNVFIESNSKIHRRRNAKNVQRRRPIDDIN